MTGGETKMVERIQRLVLVVSAVLAPVVLSASDVGRLPGDLSVSDSGSAVYSIPLNTPPGINGMEPGLALVYSSTPAMGMAGIGWNIAGMSAITRCNQTIAQDGAPGGIDLDTADAFCLDGQRLVWQSGTPGAAGAVYHTEIESFVRVTLNGALQSWTVTLPDGRTMDYGTTDDSRIEAAGSSEALVWALAEFRDQRGAYVKYLYDEDGTNGDFRISEIQYGAAGGASAAQKVLFLYEPRPAADIVPGYVAGSVVTSQQRLTTVRMQSQAVTAKEYRLTYEAPGTGPNRFSRLAQVEECAGASGPCLAPTVFSYGDGTSGLVSGSFLSVDPSSIPGMLPGDFDGDGHMDLAYFEGSAFYVGFGDDNGIATPASISHSSPQGGLAVVVDLNGNGKDGIITPTGSGSWKQISYSGSSWSATTFSGPSVSTMDDFRFADYDGDGLRDLLYSSDDELYVRLNTGGNLSTTATLVYTEADSFSANGGFDDAPDPVLSLLAFADFNGDGREDLWVRTFDGFEDQETGTCIYNRRWRALVATDTGYQSSWDMISLFGSMPCTVPAPDAALYPVILDLNGDGLADIAYTDTSSGLDVVRSRLAVGDGTFSAEDTQLGAAASTLDAVPMDYDGDGLTDLIVDVSGTWKVALSDGSNLTWPAVTMGMAASDSPVVPLDPAGIGLQGLLVERSSDYKVRVHNGAQGNLLVSVADGFGNTQSLTYDTLARSSAYTKGTGAAAPNERDVQWPMSVVTDVDASDGIGGTYNLSYAYEGARVNTQGYGFLGFSKVTVTDSRTGIRSIRTFSQTYPFIGMPKISRLELSGGNPISVTTNTHASAIGGNIVNTYPYVDTSTTDRYEITSGSKVATNVTEISTINPYNGLPESSTVTLSDTFGFNRTTTIDPTWDVDSTNWCLQLPDLQVRNVSLGGAPEGRNTDFNNDTTQCRANSIVSNSHDASVSATSTYSYDPFGNVDSVTVSAQGLNSRRSDTSWGSLGILPETSTNALDHVTNPEWDYGMGLMTQSTDPNGRISYIAYDEFGRVTSATQPSTVKRVTSYSWCDSGCSLSGATGVYRIDWAIQDVNGNPANRGYSVHDSFGRVLRQGTFLMGGAESVVDTRYDEMGRRESQSAPYFTGANPTIHTTLFSYDVIGRPTQIQQPTDDASPGARAPTTYAYNGRDTTVTDVLGNNTVYTRNAAGQIVAVLDARLTTTSYVYRPFGELSTVTIGGNVTAINYDLAGRKATLNDPDMGSWTYDYDAFGQLVFQQDAVGNRTELDYDVLGRLTVRRDIDPSLNTFLTTWFYDPPGAVGQVDYISDSNNYVENYTYDSLGRPFDVMRTVDGTDYQFTSTFDQYGRLDTLQYPESATPNLTNQPPIASAGTDQSAYEFDPVTLNGAGSSDPDSGPLPLGYAWSLFSGPSVTLDDPSAASPSFTASGSGVAKFQLAVSDGEVTDIDWVSVTITGVPAPASITPSETSDTDGSYTISWAPESLATRYELQEQKDGGAWSTLTSSITTTAYAVSGRTDGSYQYQVASCRSGGCSDYTTSSAVAVLLAPPTPASITVPTGDVDGNFTIQWSYGGGTVDSYDLEERSSTGSWTSVYAGSSVSASLTGRAMQDSFDYRVRACNTTGCSSWLQGANSLVTPAGVPSSIALPPTGDVDGAWTVSWGSSAGTVDYYELQEQQDAGAWSTIYNSGTLLSHAVTGRVNGSSYQYRVRACNAANCTAWQTGSGSVKATFVPTGPTINAPGFDSDGAYTVTWNANLIVTQHQIDRKKNSGSWVTIYTGTNTSYAESGRNTGTWTYRMQACHDNACSSWVQDSTYVETSGGGGGWMLDAADEDLIGPERRVDGFTLANAETAPAGPGGDIRVSTSSDSVAASASTAPAVSASGLAFDAAGAITQAARRPAANMNPAPVRRVAAVIAPGARRLMVPGTPRAAGLVNPVSDQVQQVLTGTGGDGSGYRFQVKYVYDAWGAMTQVVDPADPTGTVYWQAHSTDAAGRVNLESLGNGVNSARVFDQATGLLEGISTGYGQSAAVQTLTYVWDPLGNLTGRYDEYQGLEETFDYDALNRLDYSQLGGQTNLDITYDAAGNITNKAMPLTEDGNTNWAYAYNSAQPHAVTDVTGVGSYTYDANGNQLTGPNGRTISWTAYNKPYRIAEGGAVNQFWYGPDRSRYKNVETVPGIGTSTTLYIGGLYERITSASGAKQHRQHIMAGSGVVATVVTDQTTGDFDINYFHRDQLGSVSAITDANGDLVVQLSYDAHGMRRDPTDWTGPAPSGDVSSANDIERYGFTGQEQLDGVNLVHMNGRVQDPVIGRFVSADPHAQGYYRSQSQNLYSYVENRPLSRIDPTGYTGERTVIFYQMDGGLPVYRPSGSTIPETTPGFVVSALCAGIGGCDMAIPGDTNMLSAGDEEEPIELQGVETTGSRLSPSGLSAAGLAQLAAMFDSYGTLIRVAGRQAMRVSGNGFGKVNLLGHILQNIHVLMNLEQLRKGLIEEGYLADGDDLLVTGGDSYIDEERVVRSLTTGEPVVDEDGNPRLADSAHNVSNGARAVDVAKIAGISDDIFWSVVSKYTSFARSSRDYDDHFHLRLPNQAGFQCGC
jgi:RHS repeat-associated protein